MKRALLRLSISLIAVAMTTACMSAEDLQWSTWEIADGGNGHEYTILTDEASWLDQQAAAEALGGYLATLQSVAEHDFVWDLLRAAETADPTTGDYYAFGLLQDADGNWGWITGETYVTGDALWGYREPSDHNGEDYGCLHKWKKDYHGYEYWWNDAGNGASYRAIVEREDGPPAEDTDPPSTSLDEANPCELPWSQTPLAVQVAGSVTDDVSGVLSATLTVTDGAGGSIDDVDLMPLLQEDGTFTTDLLLDGDMQRVYTISLDAADNEGNVAEPVSVEVTAAGDITPPVVALDGADPSHLAWSYLAEPVLINGSATDSESGVAGAVLRVVDEYGDLSGEQQLTLNADGTFSATVDLDATAWADDDTDGDGTRTYAMTVIATDNAGNVGESAATEVSVAEDTTAPALALDSPNPSQLPHQNPSTLKAVVISGTVTDTESGLDEVTIEVDDEYDEFDLVPEVLAVNPDGTFGITLELSSRVDSGDSDGRNYTITVTATDIAGNIASDMVTVLAANPSVGQRPDTPPGQGGTPPGLGDTPPGHGGTPPGHSKRPDNPNRRGR